MSLFDLVDQLEDEANATSSPHTYDGGDISDDGVIVEPFSEDERVLIAGLNDAVAVLNSAPVDGSELPQQQQQVPQPSTHSGSAQHEPAAAAAVASTRATAHGTNATAAAAAAFELVRSPSKYSIRDGGRPAVPRAHSRHFFESGSGQKLDFDWDQVQALVEPTPTPLPDIPTGGAKATASVGSGAGAGAGAGAGVGTGHPGVAAAATTARRGGGARSGAMGASARAQHDAQTNQELLRGSTTKQRPTRTSAKAGQGRKLARKTSSASHRSAGSAAGAVRRSGSGGVAGRRGPRRTASSGSTTRGRAARVSGPPARSVKKKAKGAAQDPDMALLMQYMVQAGIQPTAVVQ